MSPWGCFIGAIACPDEQGTYTIVEVDSAGGGGFQPTGRILATGVAHGELQNYAHVVTIDDERCVPTRTETGCPSDLPKRDGLCCTPDSYEISTTFDPQQPEGVCVATHECYAMPDRDNPVGPPVQGGVDMSFCEAPPPDEEALACPTNGTFDLYDADGNHIASDVAEADLPVGAEIVASDDPRCGPAVPPTGPPPSIPTDGAGLPFPGVPPGPIPTAPGQIPTAPLPGPIPTAPPLGPQMPGTNQFSSRFVPCGQQPDINIRSLPTQTIEARPDSPTWEPRWTQI